MLTLVTAASSQPVSLADAKLHLRIDGTAENDVITDYIVAATDIAETQTGRAYSEQTWLYSIASFSKEIYLPKPPLKNVTKVQYYDTDNTLQTLDSSYYMVMTPTNAQGYIERAIDKSYPSVASRDDAVQITFVCGYDTISPTAVQLIKLIVGGFYEAREAQNYYRVNENPAVDRLISQLNYGEYR